ncbi:HNH endonuclease [Christensenella intestinihominis]|uniref:HNH endonuclease n=1 Tax=Christensenella intestinihominis TaxID=1851429 RepID=UPI0008364431|nr:hypothetical protein [Christensenella intestinihominis]
MKKAMTKATDISIEVREIVKERDSIEGYPCCIISGKTCDLQIAHYIPRSHGGLGIPENLAVMNIEWHRKYDDQDSPEHNMIKAAFRDYLDGFYPNFPDEDRVYHKLPKELRV